MLRAVGSNSRIVLLGQLDAEIVRPDTPDVNQRSNTHDHNVAVARVVQLVLDVPREGDENVLGQEDALATIGDHCVTGENDSLVVTHLDLDVFRATEIRGLVVLNDTTNVAEVPLGLDHRPPQLPPLIPGIVLNNAHEAMRTKLEEQITLLGAKVGVNLLRVDARDQTFQVRNLSLCEALPGVSVAGTLRTLRRGDTRKLSGMLNLVSNLGRVGLRLVDLIIEGFFLSCHLLTNSSVTSKCNIHTHQLYDLSFFGGINIKTTFYFFTFSLEE